MTFWQFVTTHWKSSANGILAFLIATGTVIVAFTATVPGAETAKITTGVTLGLALCRAWVGLLQKDADKAPPKP
jgi:hypothetical protein